MQEQPTISIIGAGVSGLCAAITFKNAGYKATIYEATNNIGGRVGTSFQDQYILDHGFQVLLDAYPAAQEFLDIEALNLVKFSPGAYIFKSGKKSVVGDPTRDISFLLGTTFSQVGSLKDKLKIFSLSRKLKKKSLEAIFEEAEMTTLAYLKQQGFSDSIIENFFKPFYAGIFLESHLETSSRMFEFVFKMFAQGSATLPAQGIAQIPKQLAKDLDTDTIKLSSPVERVLGDQITFKNGVQQSSQYTVIASTADQLVPNLPISNMKWHQVQVFYFKTNHSGFNKPIIGLVPSTDSIINNFHFLHDVFKDHEPVISVSIVGNESTDKASLETRLRSEMKEHCDIHLGPLITSQTIHNALPKLRNINYCMSTTETQLTQNIYLAGDHLSNGSLNAAMLNGKAAAQAVIDKIENKVVFG